MALTREQLHDIRDGLQALVGLARMAKDEEFAQHWQDVLAAVLQELQEGEA